MIGIDIAKNYTEIYNLKKIPGVDLIPKPLPESLVFKNRDETSELVRLLTSSLNYHKEALTHSENAIKYEIEGNKKLIEEYAKIENKTQKHSKEAEHDLNSKICEIDKTYNDELAELKREYEKKCVVLKEKRNFNIDVAVKVKNDSLENRAKVSQQEKQTAKANIMKIVEVENAKFEECKTKLQSINRNLATVIKTGNELYVNNKEIFDKFAAL